MRSRELQVGDWVHSSFFGRTRIKAIKELDGYGWVLTAADEDWKSDASLSPIPLTAEILKKNGFVFNSCGRRYWYEGSGLVLNYGARSKELYLRLFRINRHVHIHYVHELQRVLRCCKLWTEADNFKI